MIDTAAPTDSKWFWPCLGLIVCLYGVLAYLIPPGADTLWRLHIARGILDGQTLYRDMIEVNPPLWFWGAIPAAAFGGYPALVAFNLFTTFAGLFLMARLIGLIAPQRTAHVGVLALAAGLLLVNVAEIGQREQAFLLASALWCALIAARLEGKTVPLWLAVLVTGFAAYGFALKHYFVLVPILLEAVLVWHQRRAWRPFRPETLVLAGLALLYAAAVILLAPDFLGRILGLVQASYYAFGPWHSVGPIERQVRLGLICAFAFVPVVAFLLVPRKTQLIRLLTITLVTTVFIVLLQQKGWRYHLIAANGLSLLVLALLWDGLQEGAVSGTAKRFVPLGLAAIAWTSIINPSLSSLQTQGQPLNPVLTEIVRKEPRAHHIAIFSTAPDNAFFPLARAGRPHWSRHYSMWMMPGLLTPQSAPDKERLRLVERARVQNEFVSDLMCTPPDLIVGEVGYFRNPEPKLVDAMAFLKEDRRFAGWLAAHYEQKPNIDVFPIWRLKGSKPAPSDCVTPR